MGASKYKKNVCGTCNAKYNADLLLDNNIYDNQTMCARCQDNGGKAKPYGKKEVDFDSQEGQAAIKSLQGAGGVTLSVGLFEGQTANKSQYTVVVAKGETAASWAIGLFESGFQVHKSDIFVVHENATLDTCIVGGGHIYCAKMIDSEIRAHVERLLQQQGAHKIVITDTGAN